MSEAIGALYGVETVLQGAAAAAKGIYDPTLPLKAKVVPVSDITLSRVHHTVSIVKGRAYVFGGKAADSNGSNVSCCYHSRFMIQRLTGAQVHCRQ